MLQARGWSGLLAQQRLERLQRARVLLEEMQACANGNSRRGLIPER